MDKNGCARHSGIATKEGGDPYEKSYCPAPCGIYGAGLCADLWRWKREFDRMLAALEDAYRREHKRKPRFTKITMLDKLVLTLIYRHEYRSMDSIAAEYEVSRDTIEVNVHWVEQTLLNADLIQKSVTCVYKTN